MIEVRLGDNLEVLRGIPERWFDLIYIDPPFNTGRVRRQTQISTTRDADGDRTGFQGRRYRTTKLGTTRYADSFDDYPGFLEPRLREARRVLASAGSLFVHLDYREVHYVKVLLDGIFGRECFQNEIIWAYDYGARSTKRWPAKHDNILWYSRHPTNYTFRRDEADRIPYMAPGLVGADKAARGKTPTDTWWHTIVSPTGKEKTGYPDPETGRHARADREGPLRAGHASLRFFCRERLVRRRRRPPWPRRGPDRQQSRGNRSHAPTVRRTRWRSSLLLSPGSPDDTYLRRRPRPSPRHAGGPRWTAPRSGRRRGDAADLPDLHLRAGRPRPAPQRLRVRPHAQSDARSVGRQPGCARGSDARLRIRVGTGCARHRAQAARGGRPRRGRQQHLRRKSSPDGTDLLAVRPDVLVRGHARHRERRTGDDTQNANVLLRDPQQSR